VVVQAHLDRIQAVGERVNAFVTVLAEQALQAASQPRTGVPFTVKDSFDTAGTRTTRTHRLSLTGPAPGGPRGAFARPMRLGVPEESRPGRALD